MARAKGEAHHTMFLEALRAGASVRGACTHAGLSAATIYERRNKYPEFAKAWDEAKVDLIDSLEESLVTRALDPSDPQSAGLLKFALAGYRRDLFGQQVKVEAHVTAIPAAEVRRIQEAAAENPELFAAVARAVAMRQLEAGDAIDAED